LTPNIDLSLNGKEAHTLLVIESVRLDGTKEIPELNIRFYALFISLFESISNLLTREVQGLSLELRGG
jgi:hypothetical protein